MSSIDSDAQGYYTIINNLVTKNMKKKNEKDELDINQFWTEVLNLSAEQIIKKVTEREADLKKCNVEYMNNPTEFRGWNISLMVMSWLLYNLRKKTEAGHCHVHKLPCKAGSESHNKLYTECLKLFKDIIESFEKNPPKLIT